MKTLSPYYVYVPLISPLTGVVCNSYTMKIYIWEGSKIAAPSTPSYTITKINAAASAGSDKINIARIVNDFIEFECEQVLTTSLVDSNNQVWVKTECYYDDLPTMPGLFMIELALKGYGYFLEGENPQPPANKILLEGDEFKVNRKGFFVLPLLANEPYSPPREFAITQFNLIGVNLYFLELSSNFIYTQFVVYARTTGVTEWTPIVANADNVLIPEPIASGPFEVKVTTFDNITAQIITSNIYPVS